MTLQTDRPLEYRSLHPTYKSVSELVKRVDEGKLDLAPPYQRGHVWTPVQRLGLVKSWLLGVSAGVVVLSDRTNPTWTSTHPDRNPNNTVDEHWWACVDGKQRITTALLWQHGELAIPASWLPDDHIASTHQTADGPYVYRSELTPKGRLLFDRHAGLQVNGAGTAQQPADLHRAARIAAS
ncbi:DUF262 domain-containing protein [Kitasatospora sp. NPDC056783]|uniref:DUF262 domain-containing protein n=1 Tax=Kitasatospora sp. NPDC056783 TaxID=3345943 RepID=UPI0036C59D21